MSDYEQHLLPYLDPAKIQTLSCGHVIPSCNLLAVPVLQASNGADFDFTFEGRNKESTVSFYILSTGVILTYPEDYQPRASDSQHGSAHP